MRFSEIHAAIFRSMNCNFDQILCVRFLYFRWFHFICLHSFALLIFIFFLFYSMACLLNAPRTKENKSAVFRCTSGWMWLSHFLVVCAAINPLFRHFVIWWKYFTRYNNTYCVYSMHLSARVTDRSPHLCIVFFSSSLFTPFVILISYWDANKRKTKTHHTNKHST